MSLLGKHLIVAGGSSGMGFAVAQAALAEGSTVTIVGRSQSRLDKAVAGLGHDARLHSFAGDITSETDVARLFELVGGFHYLVNTAADAANAYFPIAELDLLTARKYVDSKLMGALLLVKYGSRQIDRRGSFTFTSGIAAYRPLANASIVAAANGALGALARALAVELAPIRVNVISPGWVDTPIWDAVAGDQKEERLQQMAQRLPSRKVGKPEDIAQAVLPLMQNSFITGTVLHVDGGQRLV